MTDNTQLVSELLKKLGTLLSMCSEEFIDHPEYELCANINSAIRVLQGIKELSERLPKNAWLAEKCKIGTVTIGEDGKPVSSEGAVFTRCRGPEKTLYFNDTSDVLATPPGYTVRSRTSQPVMHMQHVGTTVVIDVERSDGKRNKPVVLNIPARTATGGSNTSSHFTSLFTSSRGSNINPGETVVNMGGIMAMGNIINHSVTNRTGPRPAAQHMSSTTTVRSLGGGKPRSARMMRPGS